MTSKIKVDNINKVSDDSNIVNKCGTTITLGASGDTIALASGASQTGFGRTGTVDWDTTAKTASFTAVSGDGYFVNTTSGAITVTLPAGSAGSIVSLKDYANTWQTNNVTITPNGTDKINGTNANATLDTQDQSVTLVYVDSTKGWRVVQDSTSSVDGASFISATGGTITCCGDYKIHTFTGPGTFTVSCAGNSTGSNTVDYLVVAGGGSGGADAGAGGGAGGLRAAATTFSIGCAPAKPLVCGVTALPVVAQGYPITVGGGGASPGPGNGSPGCAPHGQNGSNSIFSTITSAGGGGGGGGVDNAPPQGGGYGNDGGSGGGGRGNCASRGGGSGNTPPVSPAQGTDGGTGGGPCSGGSGGGGGAIGVGANGSSGPPSGPGNAGVGGAGGGFTCGAFGSSNGECSSCLQYFAGGGAGGGLVTTPRAGGLGGGGDNGSPAGENGTDNTGGGAGGGRGNDVGGGAGGSGIVIIRYKFQ